MISSLTGQEHIRAEESIPPCGFRKVIPIAFATDDNYAPYVSVAIASIIYNASPENFYRIYVFYTCLTSKHIKALEGLSTIAVCVRCLDVSTILSTKQVDLYTRAYYTKETFYRFLIPEILSCFDYVIYLDGDLIVDADVAGILCNLENNTEYYVAAVYNPVIRETATYIRDELEVDPECYFNAGVLVLNVKKWREDCIEEKCFRLIAETLSNPLLFLDQDILNICCNGRVYFLGIEWNYMWHFIYESNEQRELWNSLCSEEQIAFKVLHFTSSLKPWEKVELPLAAIFWNYAAKSPLFLEIMMRAQIVNCYALDVANKGLEDLQREALKMRRDRLKDVLLPATQKTSATEQSATAAWREVENIHHSATYRIGRAITWAPRMVRGFVRCYREHGWLYTWQRVVAYIGGE